VHDSHGPAKRLGCTLGRQDAQQLELLQSAGRGQFDAVTLLQLAGFRIRTRQQHGIGRVEEGHLVVNNVLAALFLGQVAERVCAQEVNAQHQDPVTGLRVTDVALQQR